MPTITDLLDEFARTRRGSGKKRSGVQRYEACLKRIDSWLAARGLRDVSAIDDLVVVEYRDHCIEDRENKASTVEKHLTALRAFALWATKQGHMSGDPTAEVEWPQRLRPAPKPLTPAELAKLWAILADEPLGIFEHWRHQRNRLVILLMYYAGLRRGEVARLRVADVNLAAGILTIRDSKSGDRAVAIHPELLVVLADAVAGRRQTDPVAPSERGRAMKPADVGKIFEGWLARRGLRISAHRLRHTFATEVYRNSRDLLALQQALGHKSPETTKMYTAIDVEDQRQAVAQLPPLERWAARPAAD